MDDHPLLEPDRHGRRVGRPTLREQQGQVSVRDQILAKAADLFLRHGYTGVSINDITHNAHVTKPTLYHYFGDKENLFALAMVHLLAIAHEDVVQTLEQATPIGEKLLHLFHAMQAHRPYTLSCLMRDALAHLDPFHLLSIQAAVRRYLLEPLQRGFQEAIGRGEIRPCDPEQLATMVLGAWDGVRLHHAFCQTPNEQAMPGSFLALLLCGLSPTPDPAP